MNVLVTGGAGFVGSVCCEQLLAVNHEVIVLDDLSTGHREAVSDGAIFVRGDFGDAHLVREISREHAIEAVMHFAGETLVEKSMTDPRSYFENNVRKSLTLLNSLLELRVDKIVFSSTAATYGEPLATPITEDHPKSPINAYGESKLMVEKILEWYHRAYGLRYAAMRYFNAAGASRQLGESHNPESHLIPRILKSALDPAQEFVIHGDTYPTPDGTCVRDYVHVLDIAQAHIQALIGLSTQRCQGPYNIGSSAGHSVRQVLRAVEEVTGCKLKVRVGPVRSGDPAVLVASHDRLRKDLGWKPRVSSIREIVQSAWEWTQRHPNGYGLSNVEPVAACRL
ncbi:MAG TPA: UDP-glucose 4-epimerase GalE [Terriglobales bacterium]|jgi:UDP-glucose 4-epimerase